MIMTNQQSIQDALFFLPQMRPEKAVVALGATDDEFVALGVPAEWVPGVA